MFFVYFLPDKKLRQSLAYRPDKLAGIVVKHCLYLTTKFISIYQKN